MKITVTLRACAATILILLFCCTYQSHAQNCGASGVQIVTNTADFGPGSLRAAIDCANSLLGPDTILFNIPGSGPFIIYVGSITNEPLPALQDAATILDGSSQPGYSTTLPPRIVLDGSQVNWTLPINALWIQGDGCGVYGLEIRNFPDDGIDIRAAEAVEIGAEGKGNLIHSNGWSLDYFPAAPGSGPWEGCGIVLRRGARNCRILNNIVGTDFSQTLDLGNEYCGLIVQDGGDGNQIGGFDPGQGNVFANNAVGIRIGSGSVACSINRNHLFCNDTLAIDLRPGANNDLPAPIINTAIPSLISGQAGDGQRVEVYVNDLSSCGTAACQGRFYLGSTIAGGGNWSLAEPYELGFVLTGGEVVTAIATDVIGNSSATSACRVVSGTSFCTDPLGNIQVTSTADEGPGTLRAAIDCANFTPGANTIKFNIPGPGPHVILVGSTTGAALPALTDVSTIIDATTQPGYGQNNNYQPQIILNGRQYDWTAPINAIWVRASFCQIYGLQIIGFPDDAIDITSADDVIVGGINKGNVIYENGDDLDYFPDAPNSGPWNGCGIVMKAGSDRCIIQGNILGTDYARTLVAPNELCGIVIQSGGDLHQIGGTVPGQGNVIAHHEEGIRISDNSYGCSIIQNVMYCNLLPVNLQGNANFALPAPVIDSASTLYVSGTGATTELVDVYLQGGDTCSAACQGKTWIGRATVVNGRWSLQAPFSGSLEPSEGDQLTALAIDTLGNTSVFATCTEVKFTCALEVDLEQQTDASCDLSNGAFEVTVRNGLAPYTYYLNGDPEADGNISGIPAGTYKLIVVDAVGCQDTLEVEINDSGYPDLELVSQSDASCGLPNGSFEVMAAEGSPPYTYDIGNGASGSGSFTGLATGSYEVTLTDAAGCSLSLEVLIGGTGSPSLSVNNIRHASCGQADGSFSVTASGGVLPYSFDIGNGATTDTLFENLPAGMYTVTVTDVNGCSATASVIISDLSILPEAGFSYSPDADTVHFTNLSQNGNTFSWTFGDGLSSSESDPSHLYNRNAQFTVCLTAANSCGSDTYCESVNVVFPLRIEGTIRREDGMPVGEVVIAAGGMALQTGPGGYYQFIDLPPGSDHLLSPEKDINWMNGLTIFDIYLIQQHILDVVALSSPYRIIAADLNRSGTLTTFDLYYLRRLILGVDDDVAGNSSWRFIPDSYLFANPVNPFTSSFPEVIQLNALDRHLSGLDFIGVKTGDVNLSNDPLTFQAPQGEMRLLLDTEDAGDDRLLLLNFRAEDFRSMAGFQFDLRFDASGLRFLGIEKGELDGFSEAQIGSHRAEEGLLSFAWHELNGKTEGCDLEDRALMFQLRFEVLNTLEEPEKAFEIITERSTASAFRNTGEERTVRLAFAEKEEAATGEFRLLENRPNPFSRQTLVRYYLPEPELVLLSVYDLSGRPLWQVKQPQAAGWQQQELDLEALGLPDGLYLFRMMAGDDSASLKLLKQGQ